MLEQYDLLHRLTQTGFISRSGFNYDKDGDRNNSRGTRRLYEGFAGQTYLDYMLNLRLKYSEEIIQQEFERIGGVVLAGWELNTMDCTVPLVHDCQKYPVTVGIKHIGSEEEREMSA
jgi:hypothetical protein